MIQNGMTGPLAVIQHGTSHAPLAPLHSPSGARGTLPLDKLRLRHLRSASEIQSIVHLRDEIDLSVHAAAGPHFEALEKKETSAASSAVSSTAATGSGRSASCRWAIN